MIYVRAPADGAMAGNLRLLADSLLAVERVGTTPFSGSPGGLRWPGVASWIFDVKAGDYPCRCGGGAKIVQRAQYLESRPSVAAPSDGRHRTGLSIPLQLRRGSAPGCDRRPDNDPSATPAPRDLKRRAVARSARGRRWLTAGPFPGRSVPGKSALHDLVTPYLCTRGYRFQSGGFLISVPVANNSRTAPACASIQVSAAFQPANLPRPGVRFVERKCSWVSHLCFWAR
jgi:hypothetical protein